MSDQHLFSTIYRMPNPMKQELWAFIEYLSYKYNVAPQQQPMEGVKQKVPLKAGFLKGTFVMADDFDAPLEDFADYMS